MRRFFLPGLMALALVGACDDVGARADASGAGFTTGGTGMPPPDPEPPADPDPELEPANETSGEATCDDQSLTRLYLSPDDSNSMSSPVQVREALLSGWANLSQVTLRSWEFFNYYTFAYDPPGEGDLAVYADLWRSDDPDDGQYRLQIGVASPAVHPSERPPVALTLVLDTSGSMGGHSMDMLKASCRALASQLREGDTVSMVTWNTSNAELLTAHAVTGPDDETLLDVVDSLAAGGGTNLHGGLTAGYALANQVRVPGRVNRVVLISDGGANAGVTDIGVISENAGGEDEDGIYMVGIGVGSAGTYHDQLMDSVTDAGKGASVFISSADEAERVLADAFVSTFMVAARDVQVEVELPPGFELVTFSGEEWSEDPAEVEPQHLAPSDSVVFHQTLETCAPELVDSDSELVVTARYKDPVTFEQREVSESFSFDQLLGQPSRWLLKGATVMAYTEAVAASGAEREAKIEEAEAWLDEARQVLPGDGELDEIEAVLGVL